MKYRVILTDNAYRDLESVKQYIAADNNDAAKKYIERIFDRLNQLSEFPRSGLKVCNSFFDYAKISYLLCMNHIAIYQINELAKCVYILRVLSHFQDWKNILNKELITSNQVIAENETLSIVEMNETMYYDVYRNSQDEDNRKYVPDEVFETLEEAQEVVDQIIKCYQSKDGPFVYAIIRKKDNVNIGYVQLVKIEEGWEIGYHIGKIFTGNGYATSAAKLFLDYLKDNTDLKEIYGVALAVNHASRRVLEKCGFNLIYEGEGLYQGRKRKIIKTIQQLR